MRATIVVTRMAIRWPGHPDPPGDWVLPRLDLADRVAAPTIEALDGQVEWVWLTCGRWYRTLEHHAAGRAHVVHQDTDQRGDIAPGAERFTVVRLDSDDAWHPDTLAHIAATDHEPGTIVDCPNGWQLDWTTGRLAERDYSFQSPFLAVTQESRERMFDTGGDHTKARHGRRHHHVIDQRAWVQVVHGINRLTRWHDGPAVDPDRTARILDTCGIRP